MTPKAFDTLAYLVHKSGRLVTRDELMKAVWPDSFVEDANISVNIYSLRKALGAMDNGKPYIETVPRRGYRFNAFVVTVEREPSGGPRAARAILEPADLEPSKPDAAEREKESSRAFQNAGSAGGRSNDTLAGQPALPEITPSPEPERAPEPTLHAHSPSEDKLKRRRRWVLVASLCLSVTGLMSAWFLRRHSQHTQQVSQRRLTSFSSEMAVTAAAISTGSKFIAYANPAGLFVQVISTGVTHSLLLPEPHFQVSGISWFPDSAELLVDGSSPGDVTSSLWIAPVIGTSHAIELGPYPPGVVSPDGSEIAWVNSRRAAPQIQRMRPGEGAIQTLVTGASDEVFGSVSWSPSGRRLFFTRYSWNQQGLGNSGSIDFYDTRRGTTSTVLSDYDFGGAVASLPNGRVVYSKILRSNSSTYEGELLAIRTDSQTGVATGAPFVIAKWDAPVTDLSVNASGTRLALRDLTPQQNAYIGELNDRGTNLVEVHRFSFGVGREDLPQAWTPDSKALFIDSNRSGHREIYKQPLDSDSDEPFVQGPDDRFAPRVSPDGAWLLYIQRPINWREAQPASLMRVPISGGAPQVVLEASQFSERGLRFDCPQRAGMPCVLAQRQRNQIVFRAFDAQKGFQPGSNELARTNCAPQSHFDWCLAPDGLSIAWVKWNPTDNRVHVLRLARTAGGLTAIGGERDIKIRGRAYLHGIVWRPDGNGWFIVRRLPASWALLYADLDGRTARLLTVPGTYAPDVFPSPDARYVAFCEKSFASNVWLLQHF